MLNPHYVVGLADGEGSFTVYVRNPNENKKVKRRVKAEPKFYIKLIEKDKYILYELKKFFGCGSIYFQKDSRPNHQDCYRYEVFRRDDLEKIIIPFFKQYDLKFPSKIKDFRLFCRLVKLIKHKDHLNDLDKVYEIKKLMH
ncbi:MAG: LAGLIDADG family homing endonuclease [Patescibacteria group bacterium]